MVKLGFRLKIYIFLVSDHTIFVALMLHIHVIDWDWYWVRAGTCNIPVFNTGNTCSNILDIEIYGVFTFSHFIWREPSTSIFEIAVNREVNQDVRLWTYPNAPVPAL